MAEKKPIVALHAVTIVNSIVLYIYFPKNK